MNQLGLELRDEGMRLARRKAGDPWVEQAVADFVSFVRDRGEATGEQWRYDWLARGNPAPSTVKAYGCVPMTAARRGLVQNTGRYVRSVSPKSHGHPYPYWTAA